MSSSDRCATISCSSGYLLKKFSRLKRPSVAAYFWNSPSTVSCSRRMITFSSSRAKSGSQSEPHSTLTTFQPAPAKRPSSSWMIEPLPRTGPSSRCRLQLTTKIRLSRPSRAASESAGERLRLVHLAVADERPHLAPGGLEDAAVLEVAQEARLVDRGDRPEAHRARWGTARSPASATDGSTTRVPCRRSRGGSARAAPRSAGLRGTRARTRRARRAAGSRRDRPAGPRGRNG